MTYLNDFIKVLSPAKLQELEDFIDKGIIKNPTPTPHQVIICDFITGEPFALFLHHDGHLQGIEWEFCGFNSESDFDADEADLHLVAWNKLESFDDLRHLDSGNGDKLIKLVDTAIRKGFTCFPSC